MNNIGSHICIIHEWMPCQGTCILHCQKVTLPVLTQVILDQLGQWHSYWCFLVSLRRQVVGDYNVVFVSSFGFIFNNAHYQRGSHCCWSGMANPPKYVYIIYTLLWNGLFVLSVGIVFGIKLALTTSIMCFPWCDFIGNNILMLISL